MTDWFRSWHGAPTDPKWLGIARRAGVAPGIVVAVVWSLMDRASQADDRGRVTGYDAEGMAYFFGCEPEHVEAIVVALTDKGMIVDGRFASWEKRQPAREDGSSDRAKAWRERRRTQSNAGEREQTLDTDTDTEKKEEEDNKAIALSSDPASEMVEAYHEAMAPAGCPRVLKLTPSRKASALQRLKDCGGMDGWRHAMAKARASPFLTGASANGWKADFDFFMQAKSFTKLLEGSYDARKPSGPVAAKPPTGHSALLAATRSRLGSTPDGSGGEAGLSRGIDAHRDGSGVYRLADRGH